MVMETRVSDSYDGKSRTLVLSRCLQCDKDLWLPQHKLGKTKTCSVECRRLYGSKEQAFACAQCGNLVLRTPSKIRASKSGLVFCTRACKDQAQKIGGIKDIQPDHYGEALQYRALARRTLSPECTKCGYKESKKMLDVDHIDSDRSNNSIDNLQVLCVWCHAEKTRADWPEPEWK
jgi:hypothetical protein